MYRYTLYRDSIALNKQLNDLIKQELGKDNATSYPGRTVLFAARKIQIDKGFTFELSNCDLILVADEFDTFEGTIKISVAGSSAIAQPGLPGRKITVLCKEIAGINVDLKGGTGGPGATGLRGEDGDKGLDKPGQVDGKNGGKGKKGGQGGAGGKGGELSIRFLRDKIPGGIRHLTNINLQGGSGGPGGEGGAGGRGGAAGRWCKGVDFCIEGKEGNPGPKGETGDLGATGLRGRPKYTQLDEEEAFWDAVRSLAIPNNAWAAYRLRLGEYYYRAFNVENPKYLNIAFNEFQSVLRLDPQDTKAVTYQNQILNNQNILGFSKDLDIIPDFNGYEKVYIDYYPLIARVFEAATDILLGNISLTQMVQDLQREINDFNGVINALQDDLRAARIGKAIAGKETKQAKDRVDAITRHIAAKKAELDNAKVEIAGAIIGTVGLVASIAAAIPTAGMSLVGAYQSIGAIAGTIESAGVVQIIGEVFKPEDQRTAINKLEKEAKGLAGYIEDVTDGVQTAIDFPKALEEAWTVKTDNAEYQKLIADSVDLAYQQLLAEMYEEQSYYTVQAAEKRVTQAKASKEKAEQQSKGLENGISSLEDTALTLISMAQHYMNVLIKYAFYSARALEIYTLKNMSADIRYDYGYIHPDKEADYKAGLLKPEKLIGMYHDSWSTFTSLISYKEQYDGYFMGNDWVSNYHQLSFTDADMLNDFKNKPELHFTVSIQDLPSSRYEAKVTSVYIAFIGAVSKHDTITTVIEHSGRYSERKRTNTIVNVALQPRSGVVVAKVTPLESDGGVVGDPEIHVGFWGRGVAAGWHLVIEPSEIRKNAVDLSGLSEIQIWFTYQSFLLQKPLKRSRGSSK